MLRCKRYYDKLQLACNKRNTMSFKEILQQQKQGMEAAATTGTIGFHLVSGPLVGVAIGYGLDAWLGTGPWLKLVFLFVGIGAGFLNVYRDTQRLLQRMAREDAQRTGQSTQEEEQPSSTSKEGKHGAKPL